MSDPININIHSTTFQDITQHFQKSDQTEQLRVKGDSLYSKPEKSGGSLFAQFSRPGKLDNAYTALQKIVAADLARASGASVSDRLMGNLLTSYSKQINYVLGDRKTIEVSELPQMNERLQKELSKGFLNKQPGAQVQVALEEPQLQQSDHNQVKIQANSQPKSQVNVQVMDEENEQERNRANSNSTTASSSNQGGIEDIIENNEVRINMNEVNIVVESEVNIKIGKNENVHDDEASVLGDDFTIGANQDLHPNEDVHDADALLDNGMETIDVDANINFQPKSENQETGGNTVHLKMNNQKIESKQTQQ